MHSLFSSQISNAQTIAFQNSPLRNSRNTKLIADVRVLVAPKFYHKNKPYPAQMFRIKTIVVNNYVIVIILPCLVKQANDINRYYLILQQTRVLLIHFLLRASEKTFLMAKL